MEKRPLAPAGALILGLLIGAGFAVGGYFIGQDFYAARMGERYVTVKGLAEREVKSDLGTWTISYTATAAEVAEANAAIEQDQTVVTAFATAHGFAAAEIEVQPTTVTDTFASQFQGRPLNPAQRYLIKGGIKLRSSKVDQILTASQDSGELVKQGVVLGENYPQAPQYFFTKLNDIRPAMLADATRSARAVAEQFAADSNSRLGLLRRAGQGVFEISGRDASGDSVAGDEQGSLEKKVRIVSTIDYYLIAR
ncbi:MAG TPA: SIMPL domain-containing protein [Candidatus Binataceae bacterium]|nr:SIMPL domain-containing protein [Candidatus Binataceae bacterium]